MVLVTIHEPGCLSSSATAIIAVITEGSTTSPRSSTMKQRSASPSETSPMSAPLSPTARAALLPFLEESFEKIFEKLGK